MGTERPAAKTFRDLLVWRKAHEFVLGIYRLTSGFPKPETYGLALQIRRAGASIPANIAEGFTRRGDSEKVRFFNIAEGSIEESRYYLILTQDLGYGTTDDLMSLLEEVSRLLKAYAKAILVPGSSYPAAFRAYHLGRRTRSALCSKCRILRSCTASPKQSCSHVPCVGPPLASV